MRRIPAFTGEFGTKVREHVPRVYALCRREPTVVEIEDGEEALYPEASAWDLVERVEDSSRHGPAPDLCVEPERFVPEPHVGHGLGCDIAVCPRERDYGAQKNWPGWPDVTLELQSRGFFVAAAGAPDSSMDVPCPKAWRHERFLDASIELIRRSRLVVATDAGLAHLAVLCGSDLLIVTHQGRVAPGPVVASSGRVAAPEYWYVRLEEYYRSANHMGARIETVDGWRNPRLVADRVECILTDRAAA